MKKEKKSDIEVIIKAMVLVKMPITALSPVVTCVNLGQDDIPKPMESWFLKLGRTLRVNCFFSVLSEGGADIFLPSFPAATTRACDIYSANHMVPPKSLNLSK